MKKGLLLSLLLGAGLLWTERAFAQAEHYGSRPYELNLHAGGHWFDEDNNSPRLGLGGRFFMNRPSGWGFGGNFDWISIEEDFDDIVDATIDFNVYLYSVEVEYTFPAPTRIHPFVGVGIGAATFKVDLENGFDGEEFSDSETELLIPLAAGVKWFNRTNAPNWAVRAEVRDNIIRISGEDTDETTHNWEISAGISFLFGG